MSGPMGTMHVAASGLRAMQKAVSAAANNITNSETEGYSRRRVDLVTNIPQYLPGLGEVNTGVRIDGVSRIRDSFLDRQVQIERGNTARYETRQEALDQVEMIMREPSDTGLKAALGEMWDAWQELSQSPESSTARTVVLKKTEAVTDMFAHMDKQIKDVGDNTLSGINQEAVDINTLVQQIRDVDDQIVKTQLKGIVPNDLLDTRGLLVDKLSKHANLDTKFNTDGSMTLKVAGAQVTGTEKEGMVFSSIQSTEDVVDNTGSGGKYSITLEILEEGREGSGNKTLTFESADEDKINALKEGGFLFHEKIVGNPSPIDMDTADPSPQAALSSTGRSAGLRDMLGEVASYGDDLDEMAQSMAAIINQVHRGGETTVDVGEGWINIFQADGVEPPADANDDSLITAGNIMVNQALIDDPSKINAGKGDGTTSSSPAGDGSRALAIANLQSFRYDVENPKFEDPTDGTAWIKYEDSDMSLNYTGSGGGTVGKYYDNVIGRLGVSSQQANRMVDNQEALLTQLEERRESVSGVSVDEEIADLIRFQRGYQANARVMTTLSEMMEVLINLGR